jgi:mannose-6-phosphate isomerase-like protein (cupin superfamily)
MSESDKMSYVLTKRKKPSYTQRGLKGFKFPLKNKKVEVYFVDVERGHDTFIISKKITHVYYVIEGKGYFTISGRKYNVEPGMVVEVPPNVEYSYSGTMKLVLIMFPPWFKGNEKITRKNPDVFGDDRVASP